MQRIIKIKITIVRPDIAVKNMRPVFLLIFVTLYF